MKKTSKLNLLIVCFASVLISIPSYCQEKENAQKNIEKESNVIIEGVIPGKFTQDYAAAIKYAKDKKLPVLLIFTGSDWCVWCKLMDKNVFSKPEWTKYAKENLVQVWIDFPKDKSLVPEKFRERNSELGKKYGIKGYPTYIVLDGMGNKLGQLGAGRDKTPEKFKSEIQKLLTMTMSGMKKLCSGLKPEDSEKVMKSFIAYQAVNKTKNELSEKFTKIKKDAEAKKKTLDEAILNGKLNSMSKEKRAEYDAAKAAVAKAEKDFKGWLKINGRTKPTPELRQQFNSLRKAVMEAQSKLDSF